MRVGPATGLFRESSRPGAMAEGVAVAKINTGWAPGPTPQQLHMTPKPITPPAPAPIRSTAGPTFKNLTQSAAAETFAALRSNQMRAVALDAAAKAYYGSAEPTFRRLKR